ncbi:MAG: hypothetical protein ACT4OZ_11860 [Gemmatimonadota bacterium]
MTVVARVTRWRLLVGAAVLARGILVALAASLTALAMAATLTAWDSTRVAGFVLLAGSLSASWFLVRKLSGGLSISRTALWIEEQVPELRFALVSALVPGADPAVHSAAAAVSWAPRARKALVKSLARPMIAASAAGALLVAAVVLLPRSVRARLSAPLAAASPVSNDALGGLTVAVTPPAYTSTAVSVFDDPALVRGLPGSTVRVAAVLPRGVGSTDIRALLDTAGLAVGQAGDRWTITTTMTGEPSVIRLSHRSRSRLLILEPVPDSAPQVTVVRPQRDTVLRTAAGIILFEARISDDHGLAEGHWEYVVTSGSGERFEFRTGVLAATRFASGAPRNADLRVMIDPVALSLGAGDVVHVRAAARDHNPVSGPTTAWSDTRVIRIARADEYDSVAVEAAPPPETDRTVLSQRMLINLTEALLRRTRSMDPARFSGESRSIGRDQSRLRRQVSEVVFSRLGDDALGEHFHGDGHGHGEGEVLSRGPLTPEQLLRAAERATVIRGESTDFAHDETPIVAINRPLLEAYNAMWDAERALSQGQARQALPAMYTALAAIQRARAAERIYLRGAPPRVVVDLARVRLASPERGASGLRTQRPPLDSARWEAMRRLDRALELTPLNPSAAADSILLLRLDIVERWPEPAGALEVLANALRSGPDATAAAIRARRSLAGNTQKSDSLSRWQVVP